VSAAARLVPAFAAGLALAWLLTSCGSGGSSTVAQQVKSAAATATTATEAQTTRTTPTKTVTTSETQTVTQPPKTVTTPPKTVTTTETVTQGGNKAAKVAVVKPTSTTGDEESGDDMPWWGWVLIVVGAAGAGIGGYVLWRRHRERDEPPAA
jgi:hypothetical protein